MASELKAKTLSGMIWSFVQRFGTMAISFVSNIVLARLLTPDDYGTIGMLTIFIAVASTFVDGGFGSALIQKKEPTREDYSTIFWWNMLLSVLLYGVLFICAPAIARFYSLPLLTDVLRVQGIILMINALSIIQQNQLRKQLKFKRLATVTVISATLASAIAIALSYIGWGVWALVAQQLLISSFNAIQLWVLNKWYPALVFSKSSFKELFGFGGFILVSNLINTLCNNIQALLLGRLFSPATLGYYTQAHKMEDIASKSISTVVDQVSYPVLAEHQDNRTRFIEILRKLILSISFISTPMMILLIAISHPLILFLYSEKWIASVPYFDILCLAGIAISLQGIHYYAVASVGKSKDLFVWTIIKRLLGLILLVVGIYLWGVYGLLWSYVGVSWIVLLANAYLTSKHIGYSLKEQIVDLLPTATISIVSFVVPMIALMGVELDVVAKSLIHGTAFILMYVSLAHIFNIAAYTQMKPIVVEYIRKLVRR
ncbi:MAG: lipopolysaccharide biosynthesis protein [Alistipes sp.]|nr:lipopolysaccharide biosynthesis protein [Alistipes sp.]